VKTAVRKAGMDRGEALEILNIEVKQGVPIDKALVAKQYDKYFASNDPKVGGSFYIQSKIVRAKEALEEIESYADDDAAEGEKEEEKKEEKK
jgi:import inner membrane translocase subunit TIM16